MIRAAYFQVFGRDVYEGQRLKVAEIKLENGEITVREFIRQMAKSDLFRKLYWSSLYVTKAIEYIHRRLLGRPTYGRQENNRYFDICAKQGFYALIDALIDSPEYSEAFGEDTVPYERYLTPQGVALRSLRVGSIGEDIGTRVDKEETPALSSLVKSLKHEQNQISSPASIKVSIGSGNRPKPSSWRMPKIRQKSKLSSGLRTARFSNAISSPMLLRTNSLL